MNTDGADKLSREELYEKVWSTPATKLSEELGISDVAIIKRCRKLDVPRPPRGYWAKIEAGHQQKRPPLPLTPEQIFLQEAEKPLGAKLALPSGTGTLHPLADAFLKALQMSKLDYDKKRVHLRARALPEAVVSKAIAPQAAGAFHALLQATESRGIKFGKALSDYDGGHFRRGHDRLFFKIEEELVHKPSENAKRRSSYYSDRDANKVPCGALTFTLQSERYGSLKTQHQWVENETSPLEELLAKVVKFICDHFIEVQKRRESEAIEQEKQRIESEIRWKKQQEEEAVRKQEEARRSHARELEAVAQRRKDDLAKAAEWWKIHQTALDFITECERRWKDAQKEELAEEQKEWLAWARETAKGLSPFESGYPEPAIDGEVDPMAFPFGTSIPKTRRFSQPPTMPTIPAPVAQQSYGGSSYEAPSQKPFPFWLKYQRR